MLGNDSKRPLKDLESMISLLYEYGTQLSEKPRLARIAFLLIYTCEMKFLMEPHNSNQDWITGKIDELSKIFLREDRQFESRFMFGALEELRGRLFLFEKTPSRIISQGKVCQANPGCSLSV